MNTKDKFERKLSTSCCYLLYVRSLLNLLVTYVMCIVFESQTAYPQSTSARLVCLLFLIKVFPSLFHFCLRFNPIFHMTLRHDVMYYCRVSQSNSPSNQIHTTTVEK